MEDWQKLGSFAARLKWARERLDLTQQQVAEKIGVSRNRISQLEAPPEPGKVPELPRPQKWHRLALLLSVNLDWLIYGEGQPQEGAMTQEDLHTISTFRNLPTSQRKIVADMINALAAGTSQPEEDPARPTQRERT